MANLSPDRVKYLQNKIKENATEEEIKRNRWRSGTGKIYSNSHLKIKYSYFHNEIYENPWQELWEWAKWMRYVDETNKENLDKFHIHRNKVTREQGSVSGIPTDIHPEFRGHFFGVRDKRNPRLPELIGPSPTVIDYFEL